MPNYPYIGEAIVRLGLYDPPSGQRLVLNAPEASRREYLVAKFQILASSENIFLMYKDGWHPAESDAKNPQNEWQWTKKTATLSFKNPKKDATLYLAVRRARGPLHAAAAGRAEDRRPGRRPVRRPTRSRRRS